MTTEELKNLTVAKSVDARGTACPGPLLEAKKAIGTIQSGEILEVLEEICEAVAETTSLISLDLSKVCINCKNF